MIRHHRGQRYELLGLVPHVTRNGRTMQLWRWRSRCTTCREAFDFLSPSRAFPRWPNRRCSRHRRPGLRVRRRLRPPRAANDNVPS